MKSREELIDFGEMIINNDIRKVKCKVILFKTELERKEFHLDKLLLENKVWEERKWS